MKMSQSPRLGWIWPKDARPGNPTRWPRRWRFFDVLTNKGPDIYVGVINSTNSTNNKTRSKTKSSSLSSSSGEREKGNHWSRWNKGLEADDTPFPWARRGAERYDFRRRKYVIPDQGTWSRVEYCSGRGYVGGSGKWRFGKGERHCVPRRYWDRNGEEYPANHWHDIIYGAHGD